MHKPCQTYKTLKKMLEFNKMNNLKNRFYTASITSFFAFVTIGVLSFLTLNTDFGWLLAGSFGATMVLVFGFPENPFAQPKNVFFGHFVTTLAGILVLKYFPIPEYLLIPIAVGVGIFFMIFFDVVHPPAGGNPIVVVLGQEPFGFLLYPIVFGSIIILFLAILINRYLLKKEYPLNK